MLTEDIILATCQCVFILTVGLTAIRSFVKNKKAIHWFDSGLTALILYTMGGTFIYMKLLISAITSMIVASEWLFICLMHLYALIFKKPPSTYGNA